MYGQSLNRKVSRNTTVVTVVGEGGVLAGAVRAKAERVRAWTRDFVGEAQRGSFGRLERGRGEKRKVVGEREVLPPDTPP